MFFQVPVNGIADIKSVINGVFNSIAGIVALIIGIVLFFPVVEFMIRVVADLFHRDPILPVSSGIPQIQNQDLVSLRPITNRNDLVDLRGRVAGNLPPDIVRRRARATTTRDII